MRLGADVLYSFKCDTLRDQISNSVYRYFINHVNIVYTSKFSVLFNNHSLNKLIRFICKFIKLIIGKFN